MTKLSDGKGFVWLGLRTGFYLMITFYVILLLLNKLSETVFYWSLLFILAILTIFTFIISIIYLTKYKARGLAVASLLISSVGVLWPVTAFFTGS